MSHASSDEHGTQILDALFGVPFRSDGPIVGHFGIHSTTIGTLNTRKIPI